MGSSLTKPFVLFRKPECTKNYQYKHDVSHKNHGFLHMTILMSLQRNEIPRCTYTTSPGGHSIVKNTGGGWLDSLGSGILVGKDILGFGKNIDLDNS